MWTFHHPFSGLLRDSSLLRVVAVLLSLLFRAAVPSHRHTPSVPIGATGTRSKITALTIWEAGEGEIPPARAVDRCDAVVGR